MQPLPSANEPPGFGALLRRYRLAAGLSQEALAEDAGLSARAIAALESGERVTPHHDTVRLLARALQLTVPEHERLEGTVRRRRGPPPTFLLPSRLPYPALPVVLTSFVGRERERATVRAMLTQDRLVTLTGPPGTGKTRLALRVAAEVRDDFVDGVVFVSLAPLTDPTLVLPTVARTLGVRQAGNRSLAAVLQDALRDRCMLLLLDNFEQVVAAAPRVTDLLAACPHVKVLVTSRSVLRLSGERTFPVLPLAVPDPQHFPSLDDLRHVASVRLFTDRARDANPDFTLTAVEAPAVATICRRLDGLPLALELAAARLRVLTPTELLARLARRLPLLTGGPQDLPARQRTLRDTIAWSHNLLGAEERALFRRLAVFAGGFTLAAAETIGTGPGGGASGAILDGLEALVTHSLVRREDNAEGRFGMLETIREYAREQLDASGEAEPVCRVHATFYLALAERAYAERAGPLQSVWFDQLECDHENLLAALAWADAADDPSTGLQLAAVLHRFWTTRGHLRAGRSWLARLLAAPPAAAPDGPARSARAHALLAAGVLAHDQGDFPAARAYLEASLALRREWGDVGAIAEALNGVGLVALAQGDDEGAVKVLEESLTLSGQHGVTLFTYRALHFLGDVLASRGEYQRAAALLQEALLLERAQGDSCSVAWTLRSLADLTWWRGERAATGALLEESLTISRQARDPRGIAETLRRQADMALDSGDGVVARGCLNEALRLQRQVGQRGELAGTLEGFGGLAAAAGQWARALHLAGAAAALREAVGARCAPGQRADRMASARQALGEAAAAAAWTAGRAMSLEEAVTYAVADGSGAPSDNSGNAP